MEVFFLFIFPITIIYWSVIQFAVLFHLLVGFRGHGSFIRNKWNPNQRFRFKTLHVHTAARANLTVEEAAPPPHRRHAARARLRDAALLRGSRAARAHFMAPLGAEKMSRSRRSAAFGVVGVRRARGENNEPHTITLPPRIDTHGALVPVNDPCSTAFTHPSPENH